MGGGVVKIWRRLIENYNGSNEEELCKSKWGVGKFDDEDLIILSGFMCCFDGYIWVLNYEMIFFEFVWIFCSEIFCIVNEVYKCNLLSRRIYC